MCAPAQNNISVQDCLTSKKNLLMTLRRERLKSDRALPFLSCPDCKTTADKNDAVHKSFVQKCFTVKATPLMLRKEGAIWKTEMS